MKQLTYIVLTIVSAFVFHAQAQTPYDSFAPECTRPMLGLDALHSMKQESTPDTLFCIVALDMQQQVLLLINAEDGKIIAYTSLADNIHKWMSVDPLADKYPGVSPYAYCHWNPVKYVDPDGMDDFFDELGNYLEHIDNGTDFVMVQNANGEFHNITEFSYGENDAANRAMLSNVATYYAHLVGLNQGIGANDYSQELEDAVACTNLDNCQVAMVVVGGRISPKANTGNNIMNALVHEKYHAETATIGSIAEIYAITMQMSHQSWLMTTENFQKGIVGYLSVKANQYIKEIKDKNVYPDVQTYINPIMPILNQSYHTLFYNGIEYLPLDNDMCNH